MAEQEIIGNGMCPKCNSKTNIVKIQSFPFPEEYETRTVEKCTQCDYYLEKDFISSNAQTSFDHFTNRNFQEKKVDIAIQELKKIISWCCDTHMRPPLQQVTDALKECGMEDFPFLYSRLKEILRNAPEGMHPTEYGISVHTILLLVKSAENARRKGSVS